MGAKAMNYPILTGTLLVFAVGIQDNDHSRITKLEQEVAMLQQNVKVLNEAITTEYGLDKDDTSLQRMVEFQQRLDKCCGVKEVK